MNHDFLFVASLSLYSQLNLRDKIYLKIIFSTQLSYSAGISMLMYIE